LGLNNALIKDPVAILSLPGIKTYTVTARTAQGCEAKDNIAIKVYQSAEIFVPNAFTPDNNGINDLFRPILSGIKQLTYFSVYNRFGQMVYSTSTPGAGWNGMIKGVMQNTGVYVWIAEAVDYKGNILKRKGTVVLIK
jgi:gliding motility-associated-like protein